LRWKKIEEENEEENEDLNLKSANTKPCSPWTLGELVSLTRSNCRMEFVWRLDGGVWNFLFHRPLDRPHQVRVRLHHLELREYKAVFVIGDQEVGQLSDEITVNYASRRRLRPGLGVLLSTRFATPIANEKDAHRGRVDGNCLLACVFAGHHSERRRYIHLRVQHAAAAWSFF
jgi:hypothetical protein